MERVDLGEACGHSGHKQRRLAEAGLLGQREHEGRRAGERRLQHQLAGRSRVGHPLDPGAGAPAHADQQGAARAVREGNQRLGQLVEAGALPREGQPRALARRQ